MTTTNRPLVFAAKNAKKSSERFFMAALFAVIIVFLLIALTTGITVYQALNNANTASRDSRMGLSLISNSIRMSDTTDAVGVGKGPEGNSLVLTETVDGKAYETRIYHFEGQIVQEYSLASAPYTPGKAREIIASQIFDFEYENGLLTVYTDQGSVSVALRSVRGGA